MHNSTSVDFRTGPAMSESEPPITLLLKRCKAGEQDALADLVTQYWTGLVNFARSRLGDRPRLAFDEEDVVLSAMAAFAQEIRAGRLEGVAHGDELLAWLTTVVARKSIDRLRSRDAARRGAGRQTSLTDREENVIDDAHSAQSQLVIRETYERYVQGLPEDLRQIAELHLGGWNQQQIAEKLAVVRWTVKRKLTIIQDEWERMARASGDLEREEET